MAIIPITNDNLEKFKLQTSPKRTLISSSNGLTGSIAVFGRVSPIEKDAVPPAGFTNSVFDEETLEEKRNTAVQLSQSGKTSYSAAIEDYMAAVNKAPQSAVKSKRVEITRFEPSHKFTKDTMRKNVVKNVLFPRYRPVYPACEWAYPNYHTLNFFTGSKSTTKSCLIYPCSTGSAQTSDKDNFPYTPGNEFTFEFWINPRYTTDTPTNGPGGTSAENHYHAGTIMHLSSSYCISLVSGSSVDQDGYPDKFRIMFQLGHAAQTRPHKIGLYNQDALSNTSTNPRKGATLKNNLKLFETRGAAGGIEGFNAAFTKGPGVIALTNDNALKLNHWHHVAIRGGKSINNRTGSFYVDGKLAGQFPLCSKTYANDLMPLKMDLPDMDPDALIVGNYLDTRAYAGNEPMLARFFNVNTAYREGLVSMWRDQYDLVMEASGEAAYTDPTSASDLGLETVLSVDKIKANSTYKIVATSHDGGAATDFTTAGAANSDPGTVFTATTAPEGTGRVQKVSQFDFTNPLNAEIHELRIWKEYRSIDKIVTGSKSSLTSLSGSLMFYVPPWFTKETRKREVLQTPFQSFRTKTDDPFNAALSFGIGGRELNLANFTREIVQGVSPRHYKLTSTENAGSTKFMSCNELLYDAETTNISGDITSGIDRGFNSIRKGNLTVLPNDNGLFNPDWTLLGLKSTHLGNFGIIPASGSITYTGQPSNGNRLSLTSTLSDTKTFAFQNTGATGEKNLDEVVTVRIGDTDHLTYLELVKAVVSANGFGNDMTGSVDQSSKVVTLRQRVNGASGNTQIVDSFPKLSQTVVSNATVSSFAGGEDDPSVSGTAVDKYIDSFGTQNLGLISLENMVSTGSIPEGLVDITSEFRGLPGVGASKATAEIVWTGNVAIADGTKIRLEAHTGKVLVFKFLNDSLGGRTNNSYDLEDNTVIIDAQSASDSGDSGGVGNINDVWYRFMQSINSRFEGLITATAPAISPGSTYDDFAAENITSLIMTQQIKGTDGNKPIKVIGTLDAAITVPNSFTGGRDNPDASILNSLEGATPENPGIQPGGLLTILNRTRDPSSNEVVFFDASNLFYGNRIKPGSFVLKDSAITGSSGKVSITIRDNGKGGLYRADCKSKVATWNEIGAIIYEEGISVIKTPNIPFFGKEQFEVTMQGDHNVHVLEINIPAPKGKINSSSNPNYKNLVPSDYASETADKFVYITSINLHDENFNIVGRANLAQPIAKRDTDGYMFRLKMDF